MINSAVQIKATLIGSVTPTVGAILSKAAAQIIVEKVMNFVSKPWRLIDDTQVWLLNAFDVSGGKVESNHGQKNAPWSADFRRIDNWLREFVSYRFLAF